MEFRCGREGFRPRGNKRSPSCVTALTRILGLYPQKKTPYTLGWTPVAARKPQQREHTPFVPCDVYVSCVYVGGGGLIMIVVRLTHARRALRIEVKKYVDDSRAVCGMRT